MLHHSVPFLSFFFHKMIASIIIFWVKPLGLILNPQNWECIWGCDSCHPSLWPNIQQFSPPCTQSCKFLCILAFSQTWFWNSMHFLWKHSYFFMQSALHSSTLSIQFYRNHSSYILMLYILLTVFHLVLWKEFTCFAFGALCIFPLYHVSVISTCSWFVVLLSMLL